MKDYGDILEALASNEYSSVKKKIDSLINDSTFLNMIVKINDPFIFDRFMKMIEYKIDTSKLYEERNKYIKKVLLDINENGNNTIPDRWIIEYIVCYYFQDNYYNFMTNFYQMITYLQKTNKDLINKDNINLYKEFIDLRNMSLKDKMSFFKLLLDVNTMDLFYDDMNIVREDSHKELVDASLKLTKENGLYQSDLSSKYGTDVYYLNGEEFYGFVRCFSIKRDDLTDQVDYIYSNKRRLGYSFSYIGDKNIGTTDYDQKDIVLFYDNIDYHDIMYVHHADLHVKNMNIQDDYLSEKENEITTPSSLIAHTNNYNEIYIRSKRDGIKPTALICYDVITDGDVLFAKKYQLSILLINKEKYKRYETYDDDYDSYTYVI